MAREEIDIGVEGNDGTGDSIRESFRKTNENFQELYAVFGQGGQISFTTLADTPENLTPRTIPLVNSAGTFLNLVELASNSALDNDAQDTITFDYSLEGTLVLSTGFTQLADDSSPRLGGPLDVRNNALGRVAITEQAANEFNNRHDTDISVDDLVITKGFADRRYITTGLPIRVAEEPEDTDEYVLTIDGYSNGNLQILSHGIDRASNGSAFVFDSRFDEPTNLSRGETVFIRFVNQDEIAVFDNKADSEIIDDNLALSRKIPVSGTIENDDEHTITDAGFDPSLEGNFLSNVAIPRKSAVRRQGDEMEGALFLSDHPGDLTGFGTVNGADDLQAATKFYVDNTSYSSTENIFVATSGDDRMVGVPKGREGTALDYSYRTINAAAQKADEIIRASLPEPGPYFQTVTTDDGDTVSSVVTANIVSPVFAQTRKLIDINKEYLEEEYLGYLAYKFPDFIFNEEQWRSDIRRILDAVSFDINRGLNANILTRQAAEEFYATVDGRFKIQSETEEILDSIDFAKNAVDAVLSNRLYRQKDVERIERENGRARVETATDHALENGEQVVFQNMGGMIEIENQTAYVRVVSNTEFDLYEDKELQNLWNIDDYTAYTTGGIIGVVYQERLQNFESIKLLQTFDQPAADATPQTAIRTKFDLIENIIENGIDAGADVVFGSNYKLVLDNGDQTFVDQADPTNLDMIPGKIIVGVNSGAKGRIVSVTNNDGTEGNNDTFELIQLNGVDFEVGEAVRYGNFVKNKQITIFVESGIYEEDLPIKLSNNVSLKGDEFRRVIIRPRRRTSQSTWADMYFYRDLEFDDIPIIEKRHSEINRIGFIDNDVIEVDSTEWISVGQEVKFVGENLIGSELQKNTNYYVTSVSTGQITISDTEDSSPNLTFASNEGTMYVVSAEVSAFLNQTNDIQGYFGRHYLIDRYREKNTGLVPNNPGGFELAANILQANRSYIQEEILDYVVSNIEQADSQNDTSSIWFDFSFDSDEWREDIGIVVDALAEDLIRSEGEFCLEVQGDLFDKTPQNEEDQLSDAIDRISFYTTQLLNGNEPPQEGEIPPDTSLGSADSATPALVGNLINLINFAFDDDYNPPKRNDADGVDVFMMSDATIIRNATVQGHGGFMVVLDPEGQILTKSPYIQTGSSFSKSDNEKRFRGGMFVDAFVGNIPARITNVEDPFVLDIESDSGQGLFIRPPELPAPFYLEGIRYQVNAIANYDSGQGTVRIFLDESTNPDGSGFGQGYQGSTGQEIFIQTAGNRSMLGNDFTQINDLGYGLVTTNGAFSEMVSMFTYYCQAAYYANNGSEIRSLNGSNGYGFFGLVAEGADPNEIPDQVTLANPMVLPCKAYTTTEFTNSEDDPFITVYDLKTPPTTSSIITIDHGPGIGVLNYRISAIENLSDTDNDGEVGENANDRVAPAGTFSFSEAIYRLSIRGDEAVSDDFFSSLQADVADDTYIEFRNVRTQIFQGVRDPEDLETRPSTAINFDESDEVTYRSLDFSTVDSLTQPLENDEILSIIELDYDFIELEVDIDNLGGGFGGSQGDTKIAITQILNPDRVARLLRDVNGRQPSEAGYQGGMIFAFGGKTHKVVGYDDDSSFAYVEIEDVDNTNVNDSYSGEGLNQGIPERERKLFAGLPEGSTAEITISISLLRATGHDFTQIGTGGFNSSNYPNVIFGRPENDFAGAYTDSPTATSSQVWERRKGRVFFVTTDQDGFFRVGKFFSVDQSTGDIEFAGDIGLTGANALGFTRGVTINEFSADDSFSDLSNQAVATERATGSYINRVLGYNIQSNSPVDEPPDGNRIGPGFVPLNGFSSMEGDLNLGSNQITNLALPGSDGSAGANKNYVDGRAQAYDEFNDLRNIELNDPEGNDLIVGTGKKRIFVTPAQGGNIEVGDEIEAGSKTGVVVDIESYADDIKGNLQIITYDQTSALEFNIGETIEVADEAITATIEDGPVFEFANAKEADSSVINVSVTRDENGAEYNFQIQSNSITNADINSSAAISQSKLSMRKADTFDESDSTNGWNGTANKLQSDLGLAKFSDENFETLDGFVRIKANGIVFSELNQIAQNELFGRTASGTGDPSAVSFSDVVKFGDGLEDLDFDNTVEVGDANFPGEALVKLETGSYGVTAISTGTGGDTIARRDDEGRIDASGLKLGGFDILDLSTTEIRFDTPGGARILRAVGNDSDSLVTRFPGNVDVGETARSDQSNFQEGSSLAGEGWLASDWIYTSFIEANSEGDGDSTGISIGANTGFGSADNDVIVLVTGGLERFVVKDSETTVENDIIVNGITSLNSNTNIGSDSQDTVTFNSSVNSNILPDQNQTRNIGSNSSRWDVVYANIFDGVATEAKYADLAENYRSDKEYEPGTVLVFGGEHEVTVTDQKGDRKVAGVVSSQPAYLMNSELKDDAVAVALQGRVPCKVLGKVEKGDLLVSSAIPGYAVVNNEPKIGTVIGKSLEDKNSDGKEMIEIVVGRT